VVIKSVVIKPFGEFVRLVKQKKTKTKKKQKQQLLFTVPSIAVICSTPLAGCSAAPTEALAVAVRQPRPPCFSSREQVATALAYTKGKS
jgi:hypothetical protein